LEHASTQLPGSGASVGQARWERAEAPQPHGQQKQPCAASPPTCLPLAVCEEAGQCRREAGPTGIAQRSRSGDTPRGARRSCCRLLRSPGSRGCAASRFVLRVRSHSFFSLRVHPNTSLRGHVRPAGGRSAGLAAGGHGSFLATVPPECAVRIKITPVPTADAAGGSMGAFELTHQVGVRRPNGDGPMLTLHVQPKGPSFIGISSRI